MFYSKIFLAYDYKKYIYLIIVCNLFSILLLSDTTSFNLGLISLQSLIYSLNAFLFISFIIFETIGSYLDFYGLTLNFLDLVFINPKNINLDFNFYILIINLKYFLFLFFNLFFLFFYTHLFKLFKILFKKKIIFLLLSLVLITIFFILSKSKPNTFKILNERITKKLSFIIEGNILRNDNWFIVLQNTLNYSKNDTNYSDFSFEQSFENFVNMENIYVIINESYPNFKNDDLKKKLESVLTADLKNTNIKKFKKRWSKNYGTQGAEMELFCDQKGSWNDFNKDLNYFLKKNNCWINSFYDRHNIFIHSYWKEIFSRARYFNNEQSFFKESYFKQDLLKLNYSVCKKNHHYIGICENEIINKLLFNLKKINKKKLVIYLTVENHIPIIIEDEKTLNCNNRILNLHPQFCTIFNNQIDFNHELNRFIKQLNSNDLLVFFSDTPPIYSKRDRIHFEDYIDVFFFTKNN